MLILGIILMAIGGIGSVLYFTGMITMIPQLIDVPYMAWIIAFVAGFAVWMFSRRARD